MTTDRHVLACPFCACQPVREEYLPDCHVVRCPNEKCGAMIIGSDCDEVVDRWNRLVNRRPPPR